MHIFHLQKMSKTTLIIYGKITEFINKFNANGTSVKAFSTLDLSKLFFTIILRKNSLFHWQFKPAHKLDF